MRYKQFGHDETLYSNLVEAIKGATVGQAVAHLGLSFEEMAEKLELYKTELQGLYDGDAKITHHIAAGLAELSNTAQLTKQLRQTHRTS